MSKYANILKYINIYLIKISALDMPKFELSYRHHLVID